MIDYLFGIVTRIKAEYLRLSHFLTTIGCCELFWDTKLEYFLKLLILTASVRDANTTIESTNI